MPRLRRALTGLLALACLLAPVAPAAPAALVLSFAATAQVGAARVTLLDLVEAPQDLAPSLRDRLARVTVGAAPALERQMAIPGSRLRAFLRQAELGPEVSVLLPEQVVVERRSQRLTSQDLMQIYTKAVRQRLGQRAGQAIIRDLETGREILLPAGQVATQVRLSGVQGDEIAGRVPAVIDVFVDGRREASARVTGQVELYGEVLVATRPLMYREVIQPEDVESRRINLAETGPGALTDPQQVIGLRTRVPVAAGQPLDMRRLEQAPLIHRGDVVNMICDGQGIKVTAKGKAEQTGFINARIRLINLASKREVWGRVVGTGTVVVDY